MASEPQGIQELSPDKLLAGFSRTKVVRCVVAAIAIHILAAAATSVGYIRDRWLDPKGAASRQDVSVPVEQAAPAPKLRGEQPPTGSKPAGGSTLTRGGTAATPDDPRKATPVYKEITELPKPGEIPKQPDDLGISIDETNK